MEGQHSEQTGHITRSKSFSFLEERDKFLRHVEASRKTFARNTTIMQQIDLIRSEIGAARFARVVMLKEIESALNAFDEPIIGRRC